MVKAVLLWQHWAVPPPQIQIDALWASYGVRYRYDTAGRRISSTDAAGNKTRFYYDADSRLTHTINALGEVEEHHYNALNQLDATTRIGTRIAVTNSSNPPAGSATAWTTLVNGIKQPALDSKVSYTYTTRGQIETNTDALGNVNRQTYNAFGETETITTAIGVGQTRVDRVDYDHNGLTSSTRADWYGTNILTSARRDAFGRVTSAVDGNGSTTTTEYDRLGWVVQAIDALNVGRSTTYDAFSRVLTQTDGNSQTSSTSYNDATREFTLDQPAGVSVVTAHNRHGETVSVRDGNGVLTEYHYDKDGHLKDTVRDSGSSGLKLTERGNYDSAVRLIEAFDANNIKTVYAYDAADRVFTRTVDPEGLNHRTRYEYDAKGQLFSETDLAGVVRVTAYYLDGQVKTQTVDPTGLILSTSYTYDMRGKTLTVTDPSNRVTQYVYDTLGRRTEEHVDPAGLNLTTKYRYDQSDNLVTRSDQNGGITHYAYDAAGRQRFAIDATGAVTETAYDAAGHVTKTTQYLSPLNAALVQQVHDLYVVMLNRLPDTIGWAHYVNLLSSGQSLQQIALIFWDCAEARGNYPTGMTPSQIATQWYRIGLNRSASADEINYWSGRIANEGAPNVLAGHRHHSPQLW